jgi:hypothetical protein
MRYREFSQKRNLNEFAPGNGESGRWYTDDQMTDLVGDGWWNDLDVSGAVSKQHMIQEAQSWLEDQGYSVHVLNVKVNDDDCEWFIEGSFHNSGFAKKGVAEGLSFNNKRGKWEWDDGTRVSPDELTPAQKQRVQKWKDANPGKRPSRAGVPDTREPARGFGGRVFDEGAESSLNEFAPGDDGDEDDGDSGARQAHFVFHDKGRVRKGSVFIFPGEFTDVEYSLDGMVYTKTDMTNVTDYDEFITNAKDFIDEIIQLDGDGNHFVEKEEGLDEAKYMGRDVTLGVPVKHGEHYFVYQRDPITHKVKKVVHKDPVKKVSKVRTIRK